MNFKKILLTLSFFSFNLFNSSAQNLIPNPGFELYDSLPCDFIAYSSEFQLYMHNWFLPTNGTSDIISTLIPSTCNYGNPLSPGSCGPQNPRTGNVMTAMVAQSFSSYQEYLEVELDSTLVPGQKYYFEFYVLLGSCSNFISNDLGAALSVNQVHDTAITGNLSLRYFVVEQNLLANDSIWQKISCCLISDSAYKFLLIGNFQTTCETSGLSTGTWPMSYYFIDDVYLGYDESCDLSISTCIPLTAIADVKNESIIVGPNPVHEVLSVVIPASNNLSSYKFSLFDLLGRCVYSKSLNSFFNSIDLGKVSAGGYYYSVFENDAVVKSERVIISR